MTVRVIDVRERVMERNDEIARAVRARLADAGVTALNLVSSPGAGKTALLERTLDDLGEEMEIAVVTGDVQTQNDADRLARHTPRLVQAVVTGGACHLDARQVEQSLTAIDLFDTQLLFIENVGNLVCPASWDLGEESKIVLFSVTEGEDKPLKYPKMFQKADAAIITKVDLLPHVPFDLRKALGFARDVNPNLEFFFTSVVTGEGMREWYDFLRARVQRFAFAGRARIS
ncbi:MAG TPA: hydrogenase nickel incorporation protein HypB [Gemmatimonadaceae bacterium]|nr:hydrogenase nickel incorporation protein HypB [Gemmatimonadaceae bacterium]